MTGENGNGEAQLGDQVGRGWDHGPAQIADYGTWWAEDGDDLPEPWEDCVNSLRGNLPCTKNPSAPARIGNQQGPATVFAGGVDVHGPATVTFEHSPELAGTRLVKGAQIPAKQASELADRSRGQ